MVTVLDDELAALVHVSGFVLAAVFVGQDLAVVPHGPDPHAAVMELVPHLAAPTGVVHVVEPEALQVVFLATVRISEPPAGRPFPREMRLGSCHPSTSPPIEVLGRGRRSRAYCAALGTAP